MTDLARLCVVGSASIRDTMRAIEEGSVEIAFAVDRNGRVVGTVSDGDIRRALLGGASLDDPIMPAVAATFTSVGPGTARADVLDLMQAREISQVPILDTEGRLVGLHLLRDIIGSTARDNVAVIMAGGRGTRLGPLTDTVPKPMLPVAGRPILERIVLHLVGGGIRRIYMAVNYLADVIVDHFGDGARFGCEIGYLREDVERPLGTAGALQLLPSDVADRDDALLVMNADLITQFDVDRLMRYHEEGQFAATVGLREWALDVPFGVVTVDESRVTRIEEKPRHIWLVNAGVYVIDPSLLSRIPAECNYAMTELVATCVAKGEPVGGHLLEGDWLDVGRVDELRRARGEA